MNDALVSVRDLSIGYRRPGLRAGRFTAVHSVDLEVGRGETVGLVGESGSGKSSLGASLLGLVPVADGTITFDGVDITRSSRAERRLLARRMQVVFQDPYGSMNPVRTVGDTLSEALRFNLGLPAAEIQDRLRIALADVGLPPATADRYPEEFSGGQRQRLAIARALIMNPGFLVCDEAVSALDLSVQAQVLNLLARLKEQRGLSYLFISHDLAVVRWISDRIVVLYAGRVVEQGPAALVATAPAHPYTRALLAAAPDPTVSSGRPADRGVASGSPATTGCAFAPRCALATDRCRRERPVPTLLDGGVTVACHQYAGVTA
jgi:oligopeptide/dipeptide ABC transporter ATP-binding protein